MGEENKKKEKLRYFDVSKKTAKVLGAALGAYLVLEAFIEVGNYIGFAHVSKGAIVYGISRITQSEVGKVLLSLCTTGALVTLFEVFRRSLDKAKSTLKYVVLAIMTLLICDFLISLVPGSTGNSIQSYMSPSRFDTFADRFRAVSNTVQGILEFILAIGVMIKYRGKIFAYGFAMILCHIISGISTALFFNTLNEDPNKFLEMGFDKVSLVINYLLIVIPTVFLKMTMKHTIVHKSGGNDDISSFS